MKILKDIEDSYNELVYKVSWPTKSQLANSSVVVMVASIIIAIVIFAMDEVVDNLMHLIYGISLELEFLISFINFLSANQWL